MVKMIVAAHEAGLKFRDGRFVEVLTPGAYRLARWLVKEEIKTVDLRLRTLVLQGQEMLTLDKVSIRITMLAKLKVVDPAVAVLKVDDYVSQLYGDVQLALRDAVGALELDAAIGQKGRLGDMVVAVVKPKALAYGVELVEAGVRDVILPGDMKAILNQVMEARKRAEAALILRREEVAATRSLANTAELLAKNPTLMKLKELEALEKVAARGTTLVIGADYFGLPKQT
jgi:regulator of protease activity HflC (stomatin/prohibitin superfamily)